MTDDIKPATDEEVDEARRLARVGIKEGARFGSDPVVKVMGEELMALVARIDAEKKAAVAWHGKVCDLEDEAIDYRERIAELEKDLAGCLELGGVEHFQRERAGLQKRLHAAMATVEAEKARADAAENAIVQTRLAACEKFESDRKRIAELEELLREILRFDPDGYWAINIKEALDD